MMILMLVGAVSGAVSLNLGLWIPVGIAIIAAVASIVNSERARRSILQAHREPSWAELHARLRDVETRCKSLEDTNALEMGAVARIFRRIAQQWHTEDGPDIDPADLKIISDVVPAKWMRRPHLPPQA